MSYLYLIRGRLTAIHKLPLSARAPRASEDDGYKGLGQQEPGRSWQQRAIATQRQAATSTSSQPIIPFRSVPANWHSALPAREWCLDDETRAAATPLGINKGPGFRS